MPASTPAQKIDCEHAAACGGCGLLSLDYSTQLVWKRRRVSDALAHYPSLTTLELRECLGTAEHTGYRTRAKLVIDANGRVGLFARQGHEVVDLPRCRVLDPVLSEVTAALRARIVASIQGSGPLTPFLPRGRGALRALDLRVTRNEGRPAVLLTLVVDEQRATDTAELTRVAESLMRDVPAIAGVAANYHRGGDPQILGARTATLAGASTVPDRVGASVHLATFGSFVQAHRTQAERLHALILDTLRGVASPRVLDLYGGSGSIALSLAARGARVHLVEAFGPAAAQAAAAARAQGLELTTEHGDVASVLESLHARGERFDAAVVNPPRRGVAPEAREALARLGPGRLVYVSCDPGTLARDLDHFGRLGYRPYLLQPVDMIPLTEHVEVLAVLERAAPPPPVVLYEDAAVVVVDKPPHEPTAPQGEYRSSLLTRVRRLPRMASAVPVHRLAVGTSGPVVFVRDPKGVAAWTAARSAESARAIYLAGVRGKTAGRGEIRRRLPPGRGSPSTQYERIAEVAGHSVLRVVADHEDHHQIRRHLAAIGHPVLADARYGHPATNRHFSEKHGLDRTFLHCARLELDRPDHGRRLVVESPISPDLRAVLDRLGAGGQLDALRSALT